MTAASASPPSTGAAGRASARWWPHLIGLALILVELCWVVPWYRTVIQITYVASPLRASLVLGGVMLVAFLAAQVMENVRILRDVQRIILGALFVACLVIGSRILLNRLAVTAVKGLVNLDPGAVLVIFAVLWLWWRGLTLARDPIRPLVVWRRFILGMLMLLANIFIVTRMSLGQPGDPSSLGLFGFFLFTSLATMSLARISYVTVVHGVRKNPFDRRWLIATLLTIAVLVQVGLTVGALLVGQYTALLDWTAEVVRWAAVVILFIVSLPWLLLTYLLGPVFPLIRQLLPTPAPTPAATPDPFAQAYPAPRPLPVAETVPISNQAQLIIFWGVVLLMLGALFFARRRGQGKRIDDRDESESLLGRGDAFRLLKKAVQNGLNNASAAARRLTPGRRLLAAARVRRIYARLMDLCASLRRPRPPGLTPLEFLPKIGELLPGANDSLILVTEAYIKVRYGGYPETQEEVEAIEAAWKHIQAEGLKLKRSGLPPAELPASELDSEEMRRTVM